MFPLYFYHISVSGLPLGPGWVGNGSGVGMGGVGATATATNATAAPRRGISTIITHDTHTPSHPHK